MKTEHKKILLGIAGGIALILIATFVIINSKYEDTDNAYTAAHVATLSPKVSGIVTEVLVEENYKVKKDQVLVRIDPRDYRNALDNLHAQIGGIEASWSLAKKDYQRSSMLFAQQAVTEQEKDNDFTRVEELGKKRAALLSEISQAELNLSFTEIKAPSDGTIGKKLVEPGMVLNPGQPLLSFVDSQAPWVIANFKETQLRKMKMGQRAEIEIDSIGSKKFEGVIESFAPGSGATFALIPPDNATGNFTKIVQRVPVRIRFLEESIRGYEDRIVPGLSAEAKINVKDEGTSSSPTLTNSATKVSEN
jgi:membrane fusion protein (multidrug efflux system)